MIENRAFEYPAELFEEKEFGRLVSYSKNLSDSGSHPDSGELNLGMKSFPKKFGNFELIRQLGKGRLCHTFLAREDGIEQDLVVKKIHPEAIGKFSRSEFNAAALKFHQESMTAASVAPELITPIVEFGEVDGHYFYVMDYVKGKSLARATNSKTLSNRSSAEIVQSAAESLHKLHRAGIFLGNIHPSNIVLDQQQYPHLLEGSLAFLNANNETDSAYQAPEVLIIEDINSSAEIWSLGAILYNCLVGDPPAKTIVPPRKKNPKVARDLETICMKCLQKKPHQRYLTMAELAEDLELFLEYQTIKATPQSLLGKLVNCMSRMA